LLLVFVNYALQHVSPVWEQSTHVLPAYHHLYLIVILVFPVVHLVSSTTQTLNVKPVYLHANIVLMALTVPLASLVSIHIMFHNACLYVQQVHIYPHQPALLAPHPVKHAITLPPTVALAIHHFIII